MSNFYYGLLDVCWGLGLICMVAGVAMRLLPSLQSKLGVSAHGALGLAAVLFLCALATGEVKRTPASS
jgi:hypothetical protein